MTSEHKPGLLERFPGLQRLRLGGRRRHIPEIRQMTLTDCGAACLAMVLGYHGRDMSLDEVRQIIGEARDGVSARSLLTAARLLGLRGRGISIDLDRLEYLPPATILHWRFTHFVIFERLGRNCVHIVDPEQGRRQVTLEQFSQCFTGVALLLEPADDFQEGGVRRRGGYAQLLRHLRQPDTLARILFLSLALQLFTLAIPLLTGMVVDRVIPRGDHHLLLALGLALLLVFLFQFLASLVRGYLLLELRTRVDAGMTLGFLDHMVSLPYPFFQLRPAGDLMMRLNAQATVREFLSSTALSALLDGLLVLVYLAVLLALDLPLALSVLVLGTAQVLIFVFSRQRQRSLMSQNLELEAKRQSYQVAILTGMQTFKAFGVEERAVQNYSNLFIDVLNVALARGRLTVWVDSMMSALRLGSPLFLTCLGVWRVMEGALSLGTMLSLTALASAILVPLANLVSTAGQFQLLGSYLERMDDVLVTPPERSAQHQGTQVTLAGNIELEKVSFRYSPATPLVVQDVSVRLKTGQMVAIVGRSGAGKTTLANLLLGLYLPTSGRVLYEGKDLNDLDLRSVRSQVGIVLQDPFFFNATLRENISLGDPWISQESIVEATKLAHIHDDIQTMPMQYDTLLADRGTSLSGGQRQRLSLARALARKPAVLLLDEATSALDAMTESKVQASLDALPCTRVVIAHRLSTIVRADLILVMDGGRLVEQGTHEELMALHGHYEKLVQHQTLLKAS
ncbi:peptidase domain-containing ABC transporter [Archangium lipolyticum]|uniref:peptidase domain-containing ABC transporter n=1 Tax=Archangium lipolyticum TaxID=2970465 RepID=UPI002149D214|nr:peptidase domain-containing ABC transporter [Archangium lipolyticum]